MSNWEWIKSTVAPFVSLQSVPTSQYMLSNTVLHEPLRKVSETFVNDWIETLSFSLSLFLSFAAKNFAWARALNWNMKAVQRRIKMNKRNSTELEKEENGTGKRGREREQGDWENEKNGKKEEKQKGKARRKNVRHRNSFSQLIQFFLVDSNVTQFSVYSTPHTVVLEGETNQPRIWPWSATEKLQAWDQTTAALGCCRCCTAI